MSGKGAQISNSAYTTTQRRIPRVTPSRPERQASASSSAAPMVTRTQARKIGGTPSSTATLMNRYGTPHSTARVKNPAHARALTTPTLGSGRVPHPGDQAAVSGLDPGAAAGG